MKKRMMLFLTCLFIGIGLVAAQTRNVTGVVTSAEDGSPIVGATVLVKNTSIGTITDIDGKFQLNTPTSAKTIQISYIGMETIEVAVAAHLEVKLQADTKILDEVVVTGYSQATKRTFAGSATVVDAKSIARKSVSNVTQALSGEAPGIQIVNTSGQPGSTASVYVRGVGSINGGTGPLYVVDGMPYSGSVTNLNPADIQSMTLLKDASATSIYGSRGANGVIVITTKNGAKNEKVNVNVEQKLGFNTRFLPRYDVIRSPEEYISIAYQGLKQRAMDQAVPAGEKPVDPTAYANKNLFLAKGQEGLGIPEVYNLWGVPTAELFDEKGDIRTGLKRKYDPENWGDYAFQSSLREETNVSLSGGSSTTSFFASVGYLNDKGYTINSSYERMTARAAINSNPVKWLNMGLSLNYAYDNTKDGGQSSFSSTNLFTYIDDIPPLFPVFLRDAAGKKIADPYFGGYEYDFGDNGRPYNTGSNAIATTALDKSKSSSQYTIFNGFANIRFLKNFVLENRFQATVGNEQLISTTNPYYGPEVGSRGTIQREFDKELNWTALNLLRYTNTFGKHNLEAFVAHEATAYRQDYDWASKKNVVDPFAEHFRNALETNGPADGYYYNYALESFFGQVNYDYASKYFVTGTIRRDGSSRFLNNKWGNFYSLGLAWMITAEDFMKDYKWLKELKLKASYGTLGQQSVPNSSRYTYLYYSGNDLYDIKLLGTSPSFVFSHKGNPDLTWERTNMFQLGAEFNINNYLEGSIEWYLKNTYDMLFDRRVAPSNGYALYQVNDGQMRNTGLDVELIGHVWKGKNGYLDVRFNGGFLKNKIVKMPVDPSTGKEVILDESLDGFGRKAGYSVYEHYMPEYAGVNPETGEAQYKYWFVDNDGNGAYNKGDESILSLPKYQSEHPDNDGKLVQGVTSNKTLATNVFVGKTSLPTVRGSFSFLTGFHGFDLSMQFVYSLGGYGYDAQYAGFMANTNPGKSNYHKDMLKRWMKPNDNTDIPRMNAGLDDNTTIRSTRFLTSSSFLSLNNIRFGYSFPKGICSKLGIQELNLWLSGDNVFLLSARKGFNPTTSITGASSGYTYTPLTTFTSGIRLSF